MAIKKGDLVMMSQAWCQRVQAPPEIANIAGTVILVKYLNRKRPVVRVRWEDGTEGASFADNLQKMEKKS